MDGGRRGEGGAEVMVRGEGLGGVPAAELGRRVSMVAGLQREEGGRVVCVCV